MGRERRRQVIGQPTGFLESSLLRVGGCWRQLGRLCGRRSFRCGTFQGNRSPADRWSIRLQSVGCHGRHVARCQTTKLLTWLTGVRAVVVRTRPGFGGNAWNKVYLRCWVGVERRVETDGGAGRVGKIAGALEVPVALRMSRTERPWLAVDAGDQVAFLG